MDAIEESKIHENERVGGNTKKKNRCDPEILRRFIDDDDT